MRSGWLIAAVLPLAAACASKSADIAPAYVSPNLYSSWTCPLLADEAKRVSARAARAAGVQDKNRTNDQVLTTVSVIVFWPALFALNGDGPQAQEVARLKGEMQALEQVSQQKSCGIDFQTAPTGANVSSRPEDGNAAAIRVRREMPTK
jgi:hypothetical protein